MTKIKLNELQEINIGKRRKSSISRIARRAGLPTEAVTSVMNTISRLPR